MYENNIKKINTVYSRTGAGVAPKSGAKVKPEPKVDNFGTKVEPEPKMDTFGTKVKPEPKMDNFENG